MSDVKVGNLLSFKIQWIQKLRIYKTQTRLFVVGSNVAETKFRILKVDRTEPWELNIVEDGIDYTASQINDTLLRLYSGNNVSTKWKRGLIDSYSACGILGFVRFVEGYYMIVVSKQSKVAEIGGHSIYKIEDTMMIYIPNSNVRQAHPDEAKYLKIFQTVDLSSDFYFSYSYDLTNSLQFNLVRLCQRNNAHPDENGDGKSHARRGKSASPCHRFLWNRYLTEPIDSHCVGSLWLLHVVHGHVSQRYINIYGRRVYVTLIGRRSSYYAGTRFMKRGCNINGDVANEIETEQIVHCAATSSLAHTSLTSYVQHRGSVPLHWQQDISANVVPSKPPITITTDNPYAQATAKHFKELMKRFGSPIVVLNLVRKRERRFRESILGREFKQAVDYLNLFLKSDQQIKYYAVDMAQLSRGKKNNVLAKLANIAEQSLRTTGFFQSKPDLFQHTLSQDARWKEIGGRRLSGYRIQTGVLRTNCVDCLDRTNSAQFVAGKCALAYQLYSLGILSEPNLQFETDVTSLYEEMFEEHGDIVALQYGGSQLVHTIQSYRRTSPQWASHSRDIVTTISRYYTNTFSDADKQSAINLFLGVFRPTKAHVNLWDVSTDHYLHNRDEDILSSFSVPTYTRWCSPNVLRCLPLPSNMVESALVPSSESPCHTSGSMNTSHCKDCVDWFEDLYKPSQLTLFDDLFALKLSNTYSRCLAAGYSDMSPFAVRCENSQQMQLEHIRVNLSSSQVSLDSSSSASSDSFEPISFNYKDSLKRDETFQNPSKQPPWLRSPTLEDFSPKAVYGIDLDSYITPEDIYQYENYLACDGLSDAVSTNSSGFYDDFFQAPTIDSESLQLYRDSVAHTYQADCQYYVDYLSRYQTT